MHCQLPTSRFVLETSSERVNDCLICGLCSGVAFRPKCCNSCLQTFCSQCIEAVFAVKGECPCGDATQVVDAPKLILKMLSKRQFYCVNRTQGCEELIPYENVAEHETACRFKLKGCRNPECDIRMLECQIDEHQAVCQFNKVECRFCRLEVTVKNQQNHEGDCDWSIKVCTGCQTQMKKADLAPHTDVCPKVKLRCPHCEIEFCRPEFEVHDPLGCLQAIIFSYETMSNVRIHELRGQIRALLDKTKILDRYLHVQCFECKAFACESQLSGCYMCRKQFCDNCVKKAVDDCLECKAPTCIGCLEFSSKKNKCYTCEDKSKKFNSSSYVATRSDAFRVVDEEKVLKRLVNK